MTTPVSAAVALRLAREEKEAKELEELEGTPPPVILPVGPGQLDKALPATRLLEKRRLMHLVHDELERQKVECAQ